MGRADRCGRTLVRAARQILAESGDTSVSIRVITRCAGVGSGCFSSHFTSGPDLFDAAVADALQEYAQAIDERLHGLDDPAERAAGGVRLSAGMAESHPEIMRILCHRGLGRIRSRKGLAPRAKRDMEEGIASGRFSVADPVIALSALSGSLLALVHLWFDRPEADGDQAAGNMAEMLLNMLGLPPDEARDVARRPLPAAA